MQMHSVPRSSVVAIVCYQEAARSTAEDRNTATLWGGRLVRQDGGMWDVRSCHKGNPLTIVLKFKTQKERKGITLAEKSMV